MQQLREKYRLYTPSEVAELFPYDGKAPTKHLKQVEEIVRKHGTYRLFGDQVLLTDQDVASLFRCIAVRGASGTPEPAAGDDGHIVFIGDRLDVTADVFVDWAAPGKVNDAVERTRSVVPDVQLLEFAAMPYGDYLAWTEAYSSERRMGKWFHRTRKLNAALTQLVPQGANDDDE